MVNQQELLVSYMLNENIITTKEKKVLENIIENYNKSNNKTSQLFFDWSIPQTKQNVIRLKVETKYAKIIDMAIQSDILKNEKWMKKAVLSYLLEHVDMKKNELDSIVNDSFTEKNEIKVFADVE